MKTNCEKENTSQSGGSSNSGTLVRKSIWVFASASAHSRIKNFNRAQAVVADDDDYDDVCIYSRC